MASLITSFLEPMVRQASEKAEAAIVESAKELPTQIVGQMATGVEKLTTAVVEGKEQLQKKVDEAVFAAEVYVTTQLALQFVSTAALVGMFILALKSRNTK